MYSKLFATHSSIPRSAAEALADARRLRSRSSLRKMVMASRALRRWRISARRAPSHSSEAQRAVAILEALRQAQQQSRSRRPSHRARARRLDGAQCEVLAMSSRAGRPATRDARARAAASRSQARCARPVRLELALDTADPFDRVHGRSTPSAAAATQRRARCGNGARGARRACAPMIWIAAVERSRSTSARRGMSCTRVREAVPRHPSQPRRTLGQRGVYATNGSGARA